MVQYMIHGTIHGIQKKFDLNGLKKNHKPRPLYEYNKITFIFENIF